jgi:hypothetical protein
LEWSVDNANSCTASGGWSGARATAGSESSGSLAADTSYTLACTGAGGDATTSVIVDTQLPPTVALWFDPATVEVGGMTRATWVARNTDQCIASGAWSGARDAEDSVVVGPFAAGASVFTLTCGSAVGSAVVSGTVTATTPVKFVAFDFVEETAAHSSVVLHPVNGEPTVGEGVAVAVLSGPVANVAFRFVDMAGNEMLAPTLTAVAADAPGRKQFQGAVNVPAEPFSVVASGTRDDGTAFAVKHEYVFRPQTVRIDIVGASLTTDVAAPLAVKVRNLGDAAQVLVRCSAESPVQISPSSARVQVAADAEETVTVEALAVGPVQPGEAFPRVSCFAVVLDGDATGQNNSSSIALPIEDVLGADFE